MFEIFSTTDVPVSRTSTALPFPWAALVERFEHPSRPDREFPGFFIPKSWWVEERGIKPEDTNDEGEPLLSADNMGARIKAAFSGYRAGIEKKRGVMVPWRCAIEQNKDDSGEWVGHRVLIMPDNVEARKAAIERGKAAADKKKKEAEKEAKKAAKAKTTETATA